MGARSSQSRGPGLNKSDGHLLQYFRNNFGAGGGGTTFTPETGPIAATGVGKTAYRLTRVDLNANETFFYEMNYPLVLVNQEKIVVEVTQPAIAVGGAGIGSAINCQILGDTDI